jgi:glucose/mannose-6-phosphate isomerase
VILDSVGMFDATAATPEQMAIASLSATSTLASVRLPKHESIANVVVLGVGTSGQVGSTLLEVAGPLMSVPVVVHRGYGIPNFTDPSTLVIAISSSGESEETLEAAQAAFTDGAEIVCITGGGALAQFAEENNLPKFDVADVPVRRSAFVSMLVPALLTLDAVGFFPGAPTWIDDAITQLSRRRDELISPENQARRMARRLGRAFPIIYGGNGLGGVAAERWKTQFNDNAKVAAFCNQVPELTHNEICGWGQDGDVTRQIFQLFMLRHDFEHPQVTRRLDLLDDLLDEVVGAVHAVSAQGEGMLAQILDLMLIGDFTSLHAAVEQGLDPGPVPFLADFESRVRTR